MIFHLKAHNVTIVQVIYAKLDFSMYPSLLLGIFIIHSMLSQNSMDRVLGHLKLNNELNRSA